MNAGIYIIKSISKVVIIASTLIFAAIMISPSPSQADATLEKMRTAAEKISSIKGDFVQEKHLPILAKPLISHGYFAYQRPASLRWEYRKPLKSVLLLHDAAANLQSMDFILQEISNWLNGRFDGNPLFNATAGDDKTVILTPKDKGMDRFIRRIELVMADQPGVMKQVTIFEGESAFTRFTFTDPRINDAISPVEFRKVQ